MVDDIQQYIKILEKKYPRHLFVLSVGGDDLYIYGENDDTLYWFAQNLSESMLKPVERIAFVKK
jgi:hypothetical protein